MSDCSVAGYDRRRPIADPSTPQSIVATLGLAAIAPHDGAANS